MNMYKTLKTREEARNVARRVSAANTGATLKAPIKVGDSWNFPGLKHSDNKGVLSLNK